MTQGERGKTGDHGQDGEEGKVGPMGPAYSSWLTRNLVKAYVILCVGFVLSLVFTVLKFDQVAEEHVKLSHTSCEAGNERSLLQAEDIREGQRQNETLDIGKLLGIEDPEQVDELRRLTRENAQRRLSRIPYVDCVTGERIPLPPP